MQPGERLPDHVMRRMRNAEVGTRNGSGRAAWRSAFRVPRSALVSIVLGLSSGAAPVNAQYPAGKFQSPNIKLVSHVPLSGPRNGTEIQIADIEIEQELSRPYAYVSRGRRPDGFNIIDLRDPS